jgi:hypothetical protein
MTLLLINKCAYHSILNDDARLIVGRVYPRRDRHGPYEVITGIGPECQGRSVAIVNSLDDAIPAFIEYYKNNPVPWEQERPALYWRHTMFVALRVEQDQQGHWLAYRDDYPLLEDTKPARFATCADAQRAADAHELDLFPNAKVIEDGLSWLPDPEVDWRSVPYLAEEDADWRRGSSHLIVCQSSGGDATTSSSI